MKHINDDDHAAAAAVTAADNDDYDNGDDYDGDVGDVCLFLVSRQLALMAPTTCKKTHFTNSYLEHPHPPPPHPPPPPPPPSLPIMMTSSNGNIFRVTGPLWGNSPHKGQSRWALMFSLICASINSWANNGHAGDLRRHRAHYGVIVMEMGLPLSATESYWL